MVRLLEAMRGQHTRARKSRQGVAAGMHAHVIGFLIRVCQLVC